MSDEQKQYNEDVENFKKELQSLCDKYKIDLVANAMIQNGLIVAGVRLVRMEKKEVCASEEKDIREEVVTG